MSEPGIDVVGAGMWDSRPKSVRVHLASLVEDFRAHAAETAVVAHRGVRRYPTTYGELARFAGRFAAELDRRQIAPGERVVLWGENSAEWMGAFFGCLLRGVLAVPLDAAGSVEFARRVVNEVQPRLIVGDARLIGTLGAGLSSLVLGEIARHLPAEPNFVVSEAVKEDTAFQIVFTSGTTAEPKGIVHTHRNVLASLRPIEAEIAKYRKYERWVHPLRFMHTLPLSHVFGQFMGLWVPGLLAAEVHFSDALEPARSVDLIRRERISVLVAVPRVLELLRGHLLRRFPTLAVELEGAAALSAAKRWWRFRRVHRALGWKFWAAISGGAAVPAELERFWNRLGLALIQGYGMTETAALVTLNHPFRVGQGTLGKVLPGREVRLSNAGEIMVRGDMVSSATWQGGRLQTRDGEWLATGDLAERTESGDLKFAGRSGDSIVTSAGLNIHPSDVEAAMVAQTGVRGCAVVACEFGSGAEPVAVVLFDGSDEALRRAVLSANGLLSEYQRVRRALRWPEAAFPYTSTGKLLRRRVRDWACATALERADGLGGDGDALFSLIFEVTGEREVTGEGRGAAGECGDNLRLSEDLGLDSLGRVQLGSLIEQRMGVELEDAQLAGLQTLGQLRSLLGMDGAGAGRSETTKVGPVAAGLPVEIDAESRSQVSESRTAPPLPPMRDASEAAAHVYPHWPWSWPVIALRVAFIEGVMRPLVGLLAAPRVSRAGADPAHAGLLDDPMLIIANHVTAYDGALVLYALPGRLRRHVATAMSGEMLLDFRRGRGPEKVKGGSALANLFSPAAYWLLTALFNVFPLPRVQGFRRSFAHAGEALDRGYSVLIFPEGTRSPDGNMRHFRAGVGLLAVQSHAPVLPVALVGLGELRSGRVSWFRSGRLEIRVGNLVTMPEGTSAAEWTEALELALRALLAERRG